MVSFMHPGEMAPTGWTTEPVRQVMLVTANTGPELVTILTELSRHNIKPDEITLSITFS
jgi:hypothetical protein